MTARRDVVILGSTGSIGTQAADVVVAAPDRFRVTAVAAGGGNVALLAEQAAQLRVRAVGVSRNDAADELRARLDATWPGDVPPPTIHVGPDATTRLAQLGCDVVLNAVAGSQGLRATLAALEAGLVVALANKESLIAGGPLVTARAAPGQLVAVDSEHSALAQCLRAGTLDEVRRLVLTASGGPFRGRRRVELADATP
ncbi:MAG: 1-deoxy-D-xylulose-5-phosphate reductoisomerase, partial [Jatrophihabitans sp.]